MGTGERGGLLSLRDASVPIAGLAAMGRYRGEAGCAAAASPCSGVPQALV